MNMQSFMDKFNKMSIPNINKHCHKTIDSYLRIVRYGEDIIMGLYISLHIMRHREHISLIKMFIPYLCIFTVCTK